ncbi:MAG: shikimate kinase [Anaerolineales bacterium]|nr:shikimate kinase [Anaerolineales bacterium]
MNIILTGFMGTGKTTVGKLLAAQLGYAFVDTDALIEQQVGRTIADIFAQLGEAAFRRMEAEVAAQLGERDRLVIATGGRLMLDPENVAALGRNGRIFCLIATPEEILNRVLADRGKRPLLAGDNPRGRIEVLLQVRAEKYGQFPQIVTSGKTAAEVAAEIMELIATTTNYEINE